MCRGERGGPAAAVFPKVGSTAAGGPSNVLLQNKYTDKKIVKLNIKLITSSDFDKY